MSILRKELDIYMPYESSAELIEKLLMLHETLAFFSFFVER